MTEQRRRKRAPLPPAAEQSSPLYAYNSSYSLAPIYTESSARGRSVSRPSPNGIPSFPRILSREKSASARERISVVCDAKEALGRLDTRGWNEEFEDAVQVISPGSQTQHTRTLFAEKTRPNYWHFSGEEVYVGAGGNENDFLGVADDVSLNPSHVTDEPEEEWILDEDFPTPIIRTPHDRPRLNEVSQSTEPSRRMSGTLSLNHHRNSVTSASSSTDNQKPDGDFSPWFASSALVVYLVVHTIPFLRHFVIKLQRNYGQTNAHIITSLFSIAIGVAIARNRNAARRIRDKMSPTKETTAVYHAIILSFLFAYIAPHLFMMLHYFCNHVPFIGVILVFCFLLLVSFGMTMLMVGAVGYYAYDVTVTLHGGVKKWLGYGGSDNWSKTGSSTLSSPAPQKRSVEYKERLLEIPPSYVGY